MSEKYSLVFSLYSLNKHIVQSDSVTGNKKMINSYTFAYNLLATNWEDTASRGTQ